jgi:hypothetical protein
MNTQPPQAADATPFPHALRWHSKGWVVVAADRSLRSALRRARDEKASWVVVVRPLCDSDRVYHYAYRVAELEQCAAANPDALSRPLEDAMDLRERRSSASSHGRRLTAPAQGSEGPAAERVVDFDAVGGIAAIGEAATGDEPDLGPFRGARAPTPDPAARKIDVTVSAQTRAEIEVGSEERVPFQIELSAEALPLASSLAFPVRADESIAVSLTAQNDAVEIVGDRVHKVDPPASSEPRSGFFLVKGVRPGAVRLAVAFRQGGSDLGVIGLAVEVVAAAAGPAKTQGSASAAPRDAADDDKLMLLVETSNAGGQICYEYVLHSERLGLIDRVRSKPLLDRGNGPAATMLAFVERVYEQVTQELRSADDLRELQRETRALGAKLCRELFEPAVTRLLWPLRHRITQVQVVSWEPYVPWELVRLCDPDSGEIDDRFLAEYGLVRTLAGEMPPRELPMLQWGYLGASFPAGTLPSVGAEMEYFTGTAADGLRSRKIQPRPIAATRDAFYDALGTLEYDVIHLSCHASSPHQSIERASLILGEETPPGASSPRLVEVDTVTVEAEARLKRRRPLVFLNACETGRVGAVLTEWGGWPNVFLRAGAGAFVGTAWSVRDKPAAAFASTFYNALLDGRTLAEATGAARSAAKKLGDASWLAFKVYGHPRARRTAAHS